MKRAARLGQERARRIRRNQHRRLVYIRHGFMMAAFRARTADLWTLITKPIDWSDLVAEYGLPSKHERFVGREVHWTPFGEPLVFRPGQ